MYAEYVAGQSVAQGQRANTKASQITNTAPCLSSSQLPEINDRLAADAQLSLIQAARQNYGLGYATNCCPTCKKVLLADSCNCRLTVTQAAALKSTINWPHTADRNA
jgi:primosomal protein N'